jgi:hypothetical protein
MDTRLVVNAGRWTCTGPTPSWRDLPLDHPDVLARAELWWKGYARQLEHDDDNLLVGDKFLDLDYTNVTRLLDDEETTPLWDEQWQFLLAGCFRAWIDAQPHWEENE